MSYNGHSFRRGAAHSAAAAGMSNDDIKTLGRWKSDAYKLYTGQDNARRLNLASKLTGAMPPSEVQIHSRPPTKSVSIAAAPRSQQHLDTRRRSLGGSVRDTPFLGGESAGTASAAHRLARNPKTYQAPQRTSSRLYQPKFETN